MTTTLEHSVELRVPAGTAYDQWTQFESFPSFFEHVESIEQVDDRHLRWHVRLGGSAQEWTAEIVEQIPGKRIAWRTVDGPRHAGVVTFHRLTDGSSRVMLQMDYEPHGVAQRTADALGVVRRAVAADLDRFRAFLEERREATGTWRGSVPAAGERAGRAGAEAGPGSGRTPEGHGGEGADDGPDSRSPGPGG